MKYHCQHCQQRIEASEAMAGHMANCPTCGEPSLVPPLPGSSATPASRTIQQKSSLLRNFVILLLLVAALAGGAHFFRSGPGKTSQPTAIATATPAPIATPLRVQTPEPTPEASPASTPAEAPVATPTPAATPDPLVWLQQNKKRWPQTTVLLTSINFPAAVGGKVIGQLQLPAQTRVEVLQITPPTVLAGYRGASKTVPISDTTLAAQARALSTQAAAAPPQPVALESQPQQKAGNALDTLVFGDPTSEENHQLVAKGSEIAQNELLLYGPGDIWENKDAFLFHQQKLTGDGAIQARVISCGDVSEWTKVGVMMRESLDEDARNAFVFNTGGHGLHTQSRKETGGGTGQTGDIVPAGPAPFWVRIERRGDLFTSSISSDGHTWAEAGTQTIPMKNNIFIGLANAGSLDKTNYAIFDHCSTSNAPSTAWTDTTIGKPGSPGGAVVNGLGEPSRRMLPQQPAYYYGGDLAFQIKVDPVKQNYLSAKLWGSDGNYTMGRIILECEGKEVGTRHGPGLDIFVHNVGAVTPGAFWFRTTILPKWLTAGKNSVAIRLRSVGDLFAYGQPWDYDTYQHKLEQPTRGLYRLYTHTDPMLRAGSEILGKIAAYSTAPVRPAEDEGAFLAKFKADRNKHLDDLLNKEDPSQKDASELAAAYQVEWTSVHQQPAVLPQVFQALDAACRQYHADNTLAGAEWGGNYGPFGYALSIIAPQSKDQLDEKVDLGAGPQPRRAQFSTLLRASIDAGRFHRQTITNQAIINADNIYRANRGLLALHSKEALTEEQARRYYREACGMVEWRGDDRPDGQPGEPTGIWMMTRKGTSHEWNWCCANCYGRMDPYVYEMYRLTGDAGFRDRAIQIARAHNYMVYPSVDEGGYRAMLNEGVICTRNVYHPGHTYYGYTNIVAALADPALLGAVQQGLADHQFLASWQIGEAALYFPDDYEKIKTALTRPAKLPPLPTTPDQPDFAWADEQNAVLSIKRGREQHFLTFARRSEVGLTRIGDAHSITPEGERVVQFVMDDIHYNDTGKTNVLSERVESDFTGTPPDHPVSAFAGQKLPILPGRPGSPADFYNVRYGDYVIGMNCSKDKKYEFKPEGVLHGTDLVSGKTILLPTQVPAETTVVIYAPAHYR